MFILRYLTRWLGFLFHLWRPLPAVDRDGLRLKPGRRGERKVLFADLVRAMGVRRQTILPESLAILMLFKDGTIVEFPESDPRWVDFIDALDQIGCLTEPLHAWYRDAILGNLTLPYDLIRDDDGRGA
jgi:hypothetical protein